MSVQTVGLKTFSALNDNVCEPHNKTELPIARHNRFLIDNQMSHETPQISQIGEY